MDERSSAILEAAIREFITSGAPVSSADLFEKYDFGIKPAMIRAELSRLTDEGYLEQPYHSAGRVPSNLGYEFFAARAIARERKERTTNDLAELLADRAYAHLLSRLSHHLGLMSAVQDERGAIVKEGLDQLVEGLAWESRDEIMEVIRDFQSLENRLSTAAERLGNDFLQVFIGRKSPVTKSDDLAVMAADYQLGGQRVVLFAIGPKRMDYEKAAALFRGLKLALKEGNED